MQFDDEILNDLIDQALADSLDLKLARARLQQARASRQLSEAGLYPTVSASAGANRSKNSEAIATLPARTLYDAGFDAAWEVDVFGGTRRGVEAANADFVASRASLDNTRVSLVAEVARNYILLRAYQSRIAIARDNMANQSETVQITEWRYQAGLARASEVEQARPRENKPAQAFRIWKFRLWRPRIDSLYCLVAILANCTQNSPRRSLFP